MSNPYTLHAATWGDDEVRAARASEARARISSLNLKVDATNLHGRTTSAASASTSSLVSFGAPHPPSTMPSSHSPISTSDDEDYFKFKIYRRYVDQVYVLEESDVVDDDDDSSEDYSSDSYDAYDAYDSDCDSVDGFNYDSSEEHRARCTWAAQHRLWVEQQHANAADREARPLVEKPIPCDRSCCKMINSFIEFGRNLVSEHDEPAVRALDGESDDDADSHGGPCAFCSRAGGYTEEDSSLSIAFPRTLLVTDDEDGSGYISPFRYAPVGRHPRTPLANERSSPDPFIATPPRLTPLPHPIFRREGSPAPRPPAPARVGLCFSRPPGAGLAEEAQRSDNGRGSVGGDDGDAEESNEDGEADDLENSAYQGDCEDEVGEESDEDGDYKDHPFRL